MKVNDRFNALKILTALMESRKNLSYLMSPQEISPMTKEICYGFCRHYFRLQSIADTLINKRPKDNEVWIVLLIGIYQLQYMNKPDYAVVKETVSLLGQVKKSWAKGLVNAVLRNFCRRQDIFWKSWQQNRFLSMDSRIGYFNACKKTGQTIGNSSLKRMIDTHP